MHLLLNMRPDQGTDNQARPALPRRTIGSGDGPASGERGSGGLSAPVFSRFLAGELASRTGTVRETAGEKGNPAQSGPEQTEPSVEKPDFTRTEDQVENRRESRDSTDASGDGKKTVTPADNVPVNASSGAWEGMVGMIPLTGLFTPVADPMAVLSTTAGIPAEIQGRLAAEISANYSDTGGIKTLSLEIDGDRLGQIGVRVQAQADRLTVRLHADNRAAEEALRGNIKELGDAIRKRVGRFQHVDVQVELKDSRKSGNRVLDQESGNSPRHDQESPEGRDQAPARDRRSPHEPETEPGFRDQEG